MRVFLITLITAVGLVGCGQITEDVVDSGRIANSEEVAKGLDVCYAAVKAADGTVLSTSGLAVRTVLPIVVYTFPSAAHGADYVCKVNVPKKKIENLSKNGSSILSDVAPKLRKF